LISALNTVWQTAIVGDDWEHVVEFEDVLAADRGAYPRRATPSSSAPSATRGTSSIATSRSGSAANSTPSRSIRRP